MSYRGIALMAAALSLSAFACQPMIRQSPRVVLRADSAEIPVHFNQHAYVARIGFVFVNDSGEPLSRVGCGGPGWPALEKKVDGQWVAAYYPVELSCRVVPDFFFPPATTYRNELGFLAYEPGNKMGPELRVKSIDGVYRLRWVFTEGENPTAKGAIQVETTSNEFRMLLRQ